MKCPFLREAKVKYCQASAYRKMIVEDAAVPGADRCFSARYADCPAAAPRLAAQPVEARCPFLQESCVEFCAAAPVTKFVPASDALLSRCNSDGHLYCELYLATADPEGERLPEKADAARQAGMGGCMIVVEGVRVPTRLSYAPNHMWLDVAEDGVCHVGIDGFLANVIGSVDKIGFATPKVVGRPVAVLTVNGVDLQMAFPNPLQGAAPNAYLRTNPEKLTADPYGAGWLFEGAEATMSGAPVGAAVRAGLIPGDSAARWVWAESNRLTEFVHENASAPGPQGARFAADGGRVVSGVAAHLEREALIDLFNEFFSPAMTWRRPW